MDHLRPWLAQPAALWLLAALPALAFLGVLAWYWRRRALRRLGLMLSLQLLASTRRGRRMLAGFCWTMALTAVVVGIAGPQWGRDLSQEVASGRDLVVVLDLSRSMLAEQPSRQERARRVLLDLADSLQKRGGHRVALVAFAGRAKLVCPLTHDYDHFRDALKQQDADHLPAELRPLPEGSASGTRLGAALRLAVEAHDPENEGFQDILLISDGDDPAGDEEWAEGVALARERNVPVHTLGVGNPAKPSKIRTRDGPLEYDGKAVESKLEERPLEEIARRTGGVYFPVRTSALPPGSLYRELLHGQAAHDSRDAPMPAYRPRYRWFFGAALLLLTGALLLGGRRVGQQRTS